MGVAAARAGAPRPPRGDGQAREDAAGAGGAHEGEVQAEPVQPPRVGLHQPEPVASRRAPRRMQDQEVPSPDADHFHRDRLPQRGLVHAAPYRVVHHPALPTAAAAGDSARG